MTENENFGNVPISRDNVEYIEKQNNVPEMKTALSNVKSEWQWKDGNITWPILGA